MSALPAVRSPTMGDCTRLAWRVPVLDSPGLHSRELSRLLLLLAAYGDAGERSPAMQELTARTGAGPDRIDRMLRELERQGLVRVLWRRGPAHRNIYVLLFAGEGVD